MRESQGSQMSTQPPKGTRDFFPEDMRLRGWLFAQWSAISDMFSFEAVDAPVLESEELYIRKAGEEITDQLFNFEDKGGRRVSLRPEFTPSLARMFLARGNQVPMPAKWWTMAQCWRYERSMRGRRREHYQWNMDVIGVPAPEAEAELLAAIYMFFKNAGLEQKDVVFKVSSRTVLSAILESFGVATDQVPDVFLIIDKMDKMPKEEVNKQLGELGLPEEIAEKVWEAISVDSLEGLDALLGMGHSTADELRRLWALAEGYGYQQWLQLDLGIVRGLAYYTGIVFEVRDRPGKLRAIAGGGRYDRLLETFGGENQPCAGFGFGDAVIVELFKELDLMPELKHHVGHVVMVMDQALRPEACKLATRLRFNGQSVDIVLEQRKMKQVFKVAERVNASYLWILAPKEHEKGLVRRKNLETREEEDIPLADFYEDHEDSEQEDDPYSDFMASQDQAEATGGGLDDATSAQTGADRSADAGADTNSSNGSSSDSHLHSAADQTP